MIYCWVWQQTTFGCVIGSSAALSLSVVHYLFPKHGTTCNRYQVTGICGNHRNQVPLHHTTSTLVQPLVECNVISLDGDPRCFHLSPSIINYNPNRTRQNRTKKHRKRNTKQVAALCRRRWILIPVKSWPNPQRDALQRYWNDYPSPQEPCCMKETST